MIGSGDRFRIICFIAKLHDFNSFEAAYTKQQKKDEMEPTSSKALKESYLRWRDRTRLSERTERTFLDAVTSNNWPADLPSPDELLHKEVPVYEFLRLCRLSYHTVKDFLSEQATNEWKISHHNLYFMQALDSQAEDKKARLLLPKLIGTYRLYRRHSVLPGILRETVIIDQYKDGHCEGLYIQYARGHEPNKIPFNAFFCDFYVIAFGAHQATSRRTEIVTVSVLVENTFSDGKLIPCDEYNRMFLGLLTGIYDWGNVLMAERVLIDKISDDVKMERDPDGKELLSGAWWKPQHLHRNLPPVLRREYDKVIDVIDNSLDGQTLTVRSDRLELTR